ncbi:MAG: glucose-1-phosphate adenylyltransferase, partial [Pseudonocardiales bacterium]
VHPVFNLYNRKWLIYTSMPQAPPAKLVEGGAAHDSMVSPGCIITGGTVRGSVLSPGVTVHRGAVVENCVLMNGVTVGAGATVRRAILDKNVKVPAGAEIGVDHAVDSARYTVSDGGVVVLGKGEQVAAG